MVETNSHHTQVENFLRRLQCREYDPLRSPTFHQRNELVSTRRLSWSIHQSMPPHRQDYPHRDIAEQWMLQLQSVRWEYLEDQGFQAWVNSSSLAVAKHSTTVQIISPDDICSSQWYATVSSISSVSSSSCSLEICIKKGPLWSCWCKNSSPRGEIFIVVDSSSNWHTCRVVNNN